MPEQQRRQVACIVRINDLNTGRYVKEEGWNPNYVLVAGKVRVSRANILGVIVDVGNDEGLTYSSVTLDDGSGKISVRDFEKADILKDFNVGDMVMVIGKPREYYNEKYIIPEIIKKIDNPKWADFRKMQLKNLDYSSLPVIEPGTPMSETQDIVSDSESIEDQSADTKDVDMSVEDVAPAENVSQEPKEDIQSLDDIKPVEVSKDKSPSETIIDAVNELDQGDGADVEEVASKLKDLDCDAIIDRLLKEGEVFETRPGRIKVT